MAQVLEGLTRREALLDVVLTNAEEKNREVIYNIREVKTGGSLGCSDHALVEFVILKNGGLAKSRARACASGKQTSSCLRNC